MSFDPSLPSWSSVPFLDMEDLGRFFSIFDRTPLMVSISTMEEGRYIRLNRTFHEVTGYSPEESLGRTSMELGLSLPASRIRMLEDVRENGIAKGLEVRLRTKDGRTIWCLFNAHPVQVGTRTLLFQTALDITRRKETQEALLESRRQLEDIAANLPGLVFQARAREDGLVDFTYMSCGGEEFLGLHMDTVGYYERFAAAVAEKDRERFVESVRCAVKGAAPWKFEGSFVRPTGGDIRISGAAVPVRTGGELFFNGLFIDVTDRFRAEEALRESEERFHLFLEHLPAAAFLKDAEGRVLMGNRYVKEKVWGKDLSGRLTGDIFPAGEAERIARDDLRTVQEGVQQVEETVPDVHGEPRRFQTIKFPIPSVAGTLIGGIAVDVTERRVAEEALRESEERLRDLAAYQQTVLEEERGRIAREIHDELAQRLTVLNMDLFWLRRRFPPGNAPLAEKIVEMIEGVEQTRKAVENIVREMRPPILDDLGLVAALDWMCNDLSSRSGVAVTLDPFPEEIQISRPVATAAYRIVQEGLTNVVRHSGAASACVSLAIRNGLLSITVSDDGRGIDPAASREAGSHGLFGMAERVRAMGGTMKLLSRAGGGTTLAVTIPEGEEAPPPSAPPDHPKS